MRRSPWRFPAASQQVQANERGEWKAALPAMKAGGPYTLTVSGSSKVQFEDVMIGEVWLCSGQSNMEMGIGVCKDAKKEIAAADYPGIRLLKVTKSWKPEPQDDIGGDLEGVHAEDRGRRRLGRVFRLRLLLSGGSCTRSWGWRWG